MEKTIQSTLDNMMTMVADREFKRDILEFLHYMLEDMQELGPMKVFEEQVTVSSNVGRLAYNAAYIEYVSDANVAFKMVSKNTTPSTGEVSVDLKPGDGGKTSLTFLADDTVTTCTVTYITEFCADVYDQLVESQEVKGATAATGVASIADEVITITGGAVGIMYLDVDGVPQLPVAAADTAGADEYECDWDDSGDTVLTGEGTTFSDATTIRITFIKKPAAGNPLADNFVDQEATAVGGDDIVGFLYPLFMLSTAGYIQTDDKAPAPILRTGGTLQAGQAHFKATTLQLWQHSPSVTFHADLDPTNGSLSYVRGWPWMFTHRRPKQVESKLGI